MRTTACLAASAIAIFAGPLVGQLSVAQIYERVGDHRAVALDEAVTATLAPGRGLQLDVAPNALGVASVVVLFADDDQVWLAARDTDGYAMERSSSLAHKCNAMVKQLGYSAALVAAQWKWVDGNANVDLRLSTDAERNLELRARARAERASTATFLRNSAPFPVAEIPENERIAGWAKLWSEVKYDFAFFDQVPQVDWDAEFAAVLPSVRAARTAPDYYRVLARSLARLHDGHTDVFGPGLGVQHDGRLPMHLAFDTERRLRIATVVPPASIANETARAELAAARLVRGEQITHWDGRPVDELLDAEIRPLVCASTPQGNDLVAERLLSAGPPSSRVMLRVRAADGGERDVALQRARYPVVDGLNWNFEVRDVGDGVVYVNLPSFGSRHIVEQFEAELPRIRPARALVFDVRANGGGSSDVGWDIVRHVIAAPIATTAWRTRQLRPAEKAWGQPEQWHLGQPRQLEPAADPFTGPVAVLVGPATFSAAEDFVAVLHASKRATVVGRATGGSTGQPLRVDLPGGGGARICTKRDTYPDGREFVGVGIQPDVVVDPFATPADDDPELARAIAVVTAALRAR